MKKIYKAPVIRVAEIDTDALIAQSPSIEDGPGVSAQSITDDENLGLQMDSKRGDLWDNLW